MSENSDDSQKINEKPLEIKVESSISSNNSQNDGDIFFSSNLISKLSKSNIETKIPATSRTFHDSDSKEKGLFDSEDICIQKKNLFDLNNTPITKSEYKKPNDALSTEPGSIKVKNIKSPNKRYSVFKLIEKDKKFKKDPLFIEPKKEGESPKKQRRDIYGNVINKKNKRKIKISFIDKVANQPLADIIDIECFRKYNYLEGIPKEEKLKNINTNCQCCSIF